jgi:hypothetical protein
MQNHLKNHKKNPKHYKSRKKFEDYRQRQCLPLSGRSVGKYVASIDHAKGKRGLAKEHKIAKKYTHHRSRLLENAATKKLLNEFEQE